MVVSKFIFREFILNSVLWFFLLALGTVSSRNYLQLWFPPYVCFRPFSGLRTLSGDTKLAILTTFDTHLEFDLPLLSGILPFRCFNWSLLVLPPLSTSSLPLH